MAEPDQVSRDGFNTVGSVPRVENRDLLDSLHEEETMPTDLVGLFARINQ